MRTLIIVTIILAGTIGILGVLDAQVENYNNLADMTIQEYPKFYIWISQNPDPEEVIKIVMKDASHASEVRIKNSWIKGIKGAGYDGYFVVEIREDK